MCLDIRMIGMHALQVFLNYSKLDSIRRSEFAILTGIKDFANRSLSLDLVRRNLT